METDEVAGVRKAPRHEVAGSWALTAGSERSLAIWLWHVTVTIPGPPFGDAKSIDEAKTRFESAWLAFKDKVGEEALTAVYAAMDHANRPERYRR